MNFCGCGRAIPEGQMYCGECLCALEPEMPKEPSPYDGDYFELYDIFVGGDDDA